MEEINKELIIQTCIETMFNKLSELTKNIDDEHLFSLILSLGSTTFGSVIKTLHNHLKKAEHEYYEEDMVKLVNKIAARAIANINKRELLIEIHSEEIPAKMQRKAVADAKIVFKKVMNEYGLYFDSVEQAKAHIKEHEVNPQK